MLKAMTNALRARRIACPGLDPGTSDAKRALVASDFSIDSHTVISSEPTQHRLTDFVIRHSSFVIVIIAAAMMTACGFQLRGASKYEFTSVHVQAPVSAALGGPGAPVVPDVIEGLQRNGIHLKPKIEEADFSIRFLQVTFDKRVLSLSGSGRAREFELEYKILYEFVDARQKIWGLPGEITIRRDFSYSESQTLAKEVEERQLIRDMQQDAAAQILRRLQAVKRPV
jgi:LPS-assembly lipoprotein